MIDFRISKLPVTFAQLKNLKWLDLKVRLILFLLLLFPKSIIEF